MLHAFFFTLTRTAYLLLSNKLLQLNKYGDSTTNSQQFLLTEKEIQEILNPNTHYIHGNLGHYGHLFVPLHS